MLLRPPVPARLPNGAGAGKQTGGADKHGNVSVKARWAENHRFQEASVQDRVAVVSFVRRIAMVGQACFGANVMEAPAGSVRRMWRAIRYPTSLARFSEPQRGR